MKGASMIARVLKDAGVKHIFGIAGTQALELFDALKEEGLEIITPTSEVCGSFMADGYARSTGRLGVCAVVPGPGVAYALSGIGEALLDNVPVLVLATDVHKNLRYRFQLHEIDQISVARPLAKEVIEITNAGDAEKLMRRSVELALTPPQGPVVVDISSDMFVEEGEYKESGLKIQKPEPDDKKLHRIAEIINNSSQVAILAGWGCAHASSELIKLAEHIQAPVATTISGRGIFPEDHPLSVGYGFGPSGTRVAEKVFSRAQVLLALGVKFSEVGTGSYGLPEKFRLIHVDADKNVIGANYKPEEWVLSDTGVFISKILPLLSKREKNEKLLEFIREEKEKDEKKAQSSSLKGPGVDPGVLVRAWRTLLPKDAIITTDAGAHMFWVMENFPVYVPRTFLSPVDFQAMGYSIPAGVGAAIAHPEKTVLCTVGDGGFFYTGFEILNAVKRGLNVKVLIFNDRALGLIKFFQNRLYRREAGVDVPPFDFEAFAEAAGAAYFRINENSDALPAVGQALATDGVVIVDAMVNYSRQTRYIKGAVMTNIKRRSLREQIFFMKRILRRL